MKKARKAWDPAATANCCLLHLSLYFHGGLIMSRSARINFGYPNSEFVVECDDSGAATSCKNVDTDTEYVGGGGDFEIVEVKFVRGTVSGDISIAAPNVVHWDYCNIDVAQSGDYLQSADNEITLNVILYKGYAYAYANNGAAVLVGDNFDDDNEVITGAGTITINAG